MTVTPGHLARTVADWLNRVSARLRRVPITLERSLTGGLIGSMALLALAVGVVVRFSDANSARVLGLIGGISGVILLVVWYTHTLAEIQRQQALVDRLHRETSDLRALHRLSAAIQASRSVEALSDAVLDFAREVFPGSAGAVAMRSAGQELEALAAWGAGFGTPDRTGSCYAIRDGRTFWSAGARHGFRCQHVEDTYVGPYTCFPIKGQPGTAGILHLRYPAVSDDAEELRRRTLGEDAASRIALGLEAIELHNLLRTQSMVDPLTGLNNRRALFDYADRVHAQAVGTGGTYTVILADVDRFKALNDALGHPAGDTILVTFARHIQRHVRAQDFACRYGGEEFVVVMPDVSRQVASERAEAMRAALASLRTPVPRPVWRLSASFGVATFPLDGNSFADVLRRADEAMYAAKMAGRNRVKSWSQASSPP